MHSDSIKPKCSLDNCLQKLTQGHIAPQSYVSYEAMKLKYRLLSLIRPPWCYY